MLPESRDKNIEKCEICGNILFIQLVEDLLVWFEVSVYNAVVVKVL